MVSNFSRQDTEFRTLSTGLTEENSRLFFYAGDAFSKLKNHIEYILLIKIKILQLPWKELSWIVWDIPDPLVVV